jgi:hypothetical protein
MRRARKLSGRIDARTSARYRSCLRITGSGRVSTDSAGFLLKVIERTNARDTNHVTGYRSDRRYRQRVFWGWCPQRITSAPVAKATLFGPITHPAHQCRLHKGPTRGDAICRPADDQVVNPGRNCFDLGRSNENPERVVSLRHAPRTFASLREVNFAAPSGFEGAS